jgi:hypothetical protein
VKSDPDGTKILLVEYLSAGGQAFDGSVDIPG